MSSWKTLSKKTLITFGKFMRVEQHAIELPTGRVIDDWPWLIGPDFINVLAITNEGRFIIFRQEKYGLEGLSLAPVGGYIEPGEVPQAAARRELLEETGYEADEWIDLGHYVVDPNRGVGTGYMYLARGARRVTMPNADDLEEQTIVMMGQEEIEDALRSGQFKSMAWATNIALALLFLKSNEDQ